MTGLARVVLVADDNEAVRYITCRTLRHANFVTVEARWGQEAVEQAHRSRPDIIILDMNMPDQSGLTTLQQLRADPCTASIPVVFLSATAHSRFEQQQAEELGASAYLFNPVQLDTLVAVIEGSIQRATDSKELPLSCGTSFAG